MYYAVFCGRSIGIYETWCECRAEVLGFPGALFKKFVMHADAVKYMEEGPYPTPKKQAVKFSK
jgi:ribonuclease HI